MKRIKGTIIFCIIFLIILIIYFILYKNINILFPLPEKEVYSFINNSPKEEKDFLLEIYDQVAMQTNYKKVSSQELNDIKTNDTLYSIIKNNLLNEKITEEDLEAFWCELFYTGKLYNTIYGDLKIIREIYNEKIRNNREILIVHSEDSKKICYIDINNFFRFFNEYDLIDFYNVQSKFKNASETELLEYNKKGKTEIINNCTEQFKEIVDKYEFNSDTIINKGNYYILKDNTNDITVYYNSTQNIILGMYMGFGK